MIVALRQPMSQEEFFDWAQSQEGRYEFDGFQPVAMTGGTTGHGVVFGNLYAALRSRLRGTPCRPLGPDVGVATTGKAVRYPDVLITCSRFDLTARIAPDVVAVFEVISPSTSRIDRIVKVQEYAAVASIRRYVMLESTIVGITVLERAAGEESWRASALTQEGTLRMPEIGIEIPVAEIYEDMSFSDDGEAAA